jgi:hypothetical protein
MVAVVRPAVLEPHPTSTIAVIVVADRSLITTL